ncbi:MAG: hypothetical protein QOF51_4123 [Chloroflexota bacterium]|jgi:hypothetical protein|nr:hypothetical protein [Chloroflexota bacterium]
MGYGAGDQPGGKPTTKTVKVRAHTRKVTVNAPVTDAQSSGGDYGTQKAEKFKQTEQYQPDTRAAYDASSPQQKRRTLNQPIVTPEQRTMQLEHVRRVFRNKDLADARAQHDVTTGADLAKAKQFLDAHKDILARPTKSISTLATILGTGAKVASAAGNVLSGKTTAGVVNAAANAVGDAINAPAAAGAWAGNATADCWAVRPGREAATRVHCSRCTGTIGEQNSYGNDPYPPRG